MIIRHPTRRLAPLLAALAVLATALFVSPVASAESPTVTVQPARAAPGDVVTVTGAGFPPGASLSVTVDGVVVLKSDAWTVGVDGALPPMNVEVPARPRGTYAVRVSAGGAEGSADLAVRSVVLPGNAEARPGERLSFAALGFRAGSPLTVTWDGDPIATEPASVRSDASGTASFSLAVPADDLASHQVLVVDASANQGYAIVGVRPLLRVATGAASPGDSITLSGVGFNARANVEVHLVRPGGFEEPATTVPDVVVVDALGNWGSIDVLVPRLATGEYTVRAVDARGGSAEGTFRVRPALTVDPPAALAGENVTVAGVGWPAGARVALAFDGATLAGTAVVADASGSFEGLVVRVPAHEPGSFALSATATGSSAAAETLLTVSPPPTDPTARPPQESRHVASPAEADGRDGWYRTAPTVVLVGGRSDVLRHRLDEGAWEAYAAPVRVPDGRHVLEYYATSATGVAEAAPHRVAFAVDASPPVLEQVLIEGSGDTRAFSALASDSTSGVASVEFTVAGPGGELVLAGAFRDGAFRATFLPPVPGTYRLDARVLDVAGNDVSRGNYAFDVTAAELASDAVDDVAGGAPGDAPEEAAAPSAPVPAGGALVAAAALALGAGVVTRGGARGASSRPRARRR